MNHCNTYIRAAWNLVNSSARNSSLAKINLTTCCGNNVKLPKFNTSFPCSSTNSKTFCTKLFVHLYWIYLSADANNAQTVSTLMQHCTKPAQALRNSSKPGRWERDLVVWKIYTKIRFESVFGNPCKPVNYSHLIFGPLKLGLGTGLGWPEPNLD